MEKLTLTVRPIGANGDYELWKQLSSFVKSNFGILYVGAERLKQYSAIDCTVLSEDYYAGNRIQIGDTRLNESDGVKICNGWHCRKSDGYPSESQLRQAVKEIQQLLDAAAEPIPASFELRIVDRRIEENVYAKLAEDE